MRSPTCGSSSTRCAAPPTNACHAQSTVRESLSSMPVQVLHPSLLLVILLLANVMLRTVVTPMDLVALTLSGKLPYFATLAERCSTKDPNDRMQLLSFFRRTRQPPPSFSLSIRLCPHPPFSSKFWCVYRDPRLSGHDCGGRQPGLHAAAATAARQRRGGSAALLPRPRPPHGKSYAHMSCHECSIQDWAFRCRLWAGLQEACAGAQAILGVYRAAGLRLELTAARFPAPYVQLMAMLVFAVRAEYQEGAGRRRLPAGFDWGVWACRVLGRASSRHPPGFQVLPCLSCCQKTWLPTQPIGLGGAAAGP